MYREWWFPWKNLSSYLFVKFTLVIHSMIFSFSISTTIALGPGETAKLIAKEILPTLVRRGVIYYSNCREPTSYPPSKL